MILATVPPAIKAVLVLKLTIETSSKTYPVEIGSDIFKKAYFYLYRALEPVSNVWIIADETVASLYLDRLQNCLNSIFSANGYYDCA